MKTEICLDVRFVVTGEDGFPRIPYSGEVARFEIEVSTDKIPDKDRVLEIVKKTGEFFQNLYLDEVDEI